MLLPCPKFFQIISFPSHPTLTSFTKNKQKPNTTKNKKQSNHPQTPKTIKNQILEDKCQTVTKYNHAETCSVKLSV